MLKPLSSFFLVSVLATGSLFAQENGEVETPVFVVIQERTDKKPQAGKKPFALKQLGFDASAEIPKEDIALRSGVEYSSFKPGNKWSGILPPFFPEEYALGGEDLIPLTDVTSIGALMYGHYGPDHYNTRSVTAVNANRHEVAIFTAYGFPNIARCFFDEESGIFYYTVVEGNYGTKEAARLHAFSTKTEKELWRTSIGTAHGDFLVFEDHIITHFGFTGEDDFLFVIDKGDGSTLKKEPLKTAADALILEKDGTITVPAYTGVYRYEFSATP